MRSQTNQVMGVAALLLTTLCTNVCIAQSGEKASGPLSLDKSKGKAPLSVSVEAPAELVELWTSWQRRNCVHGKWGDGFYIDWGDGTGDGDSSIGGRKPATVEVGRHLYSKPGIYSVKAGLYQFMPNDSHRQYWQGDAQVTVKDK